MSTRKSVCCSARPDGSLHRLEFFRKQTLTGSCVADASLPSYLCRQKHTSSTNSIFSHTSFERHLLPYIFPKHHHERFRRALHGRSMRLFTYQRPRKSSHRRAISRCHHHLRQPRIQGSSSGGLHAKPVVRCGLHHSAQSTYLHQ